MRKVQARIYKVVIDHRKFEDHEAGVRCFWQTLEPLTQEVPGVRAEGYFGEALSRQVEFLDTEEFVLRKEHLILRRRSNEDITEYTLRCRADDRYVAVGAPVRCAAGFKSNRKLIEEIATPFRSRFAYSDTVRFKKGRLFKRTPSTLRQAAKVFPHLAELRAGSLELPPLTPLVAVGRQHVHEEVWLGPKLVFDGLGDSFETDRAATAITLWSDGKSGRPYVAEFSFLLEHRRERFGRDLVIVARNFFDALQHLPDWFIKDSPSKSELIYGDRRGD